jgi:hypothetical protein
MLTRSSDVPWSKHCMILELRAQFPNDGLFTELSEATVTFARLPPPPRFYGSERVVMSIEHSSTFVGTCKNLARSRNAKNHPLLDQLRSVPPLCEAGAWSKVTKVVLDVTADAS